MILHEGEKRLNVRDKKQNVTDRMGKIDTDGITMDTSYVALVSPGYPIEDIFFYGSSKLRCIDYQEQTYALIHVLLYYLILLSRA
jgi:hypothetical protein